MNTFASRARATLLLGGLLALAAGLWLAGGSDRAAVLSGRPGLADLVAALAGGVAALALVWLALLTALLVLEPVAGRRLTDRAACPPGLRRLLLVVCGAVTTTALALPAHASTGTGPGDQPSPTTTSSAARSSDTSALLDGLPLPDRPVGRPLDSSWSKPVRVPSPTTDPAGDRPVAAPRSADPSRGRAQDQATRHPRARPHDQAHDRAHDRAPERSSDPDARATTTRPWSGSWSGSGSGSGPREPQDAAADPEATCTVQAGDTLWGIAGRRLQERLGTTPGTAATARAWRLLYDANRSLVGSDPDLIHPGTTLRVPSSLQEDPS